MIVDTIKKTVTPQGESLGQIVEDLKGMFQETWKDFTITPEVVTAKEYFPSYPMPYQDISQPPDSNTIPHYPFFTSCYNTRHPFLD